LTRSTGSPSPVWPVFVAYAIAFLLILVGSFALIAVVVATRAHGAGVEQVSEVVLAFIKSAPGMLASAAVSEGSFLAVAIAGAWILERSVVAGLRLGATRATALGYVAAAVGTAALSVMSGTAAELVKFHNPNGAMETIATSLSHPRPGIVVLAVLLLGVAPGIAEEAFFRGLMETRITARYGRWVGIVVAAFFFGLIHLDLLQSPVAFLLGIYLGWCSEVLGGIRPSMLAHAVNNAIFVAAACLGDSGPSHGNSLRESLVVLTVGGGFFLAATALLRSPLSVRAQP
jgi:membrane protease YdiL (CAAX protease family)